MFAAVGHADEQVDVPSDAALERTEVAEKAARSVKSRSSEKVDPETIAKDWFEAMDSGDLEVKIILRDSTRGNVLIKNTTDEELVVRLPATFAAIPVVGQFGGGGIGGGGGGLGGGGLGGGGGGQQAGGGGLGGGGGGGLGGGGLGGGGGGFQRIAPQKGRRLPVQIVCLEHGKKDPHPKIPYKMVPLEEFSGDQRIAAVCQKLGNGEVTQKTAQAASWHIMDNLSWQELAVKNSVESKYRGNIRWFSPIELRFAQTLVSYANAVAAATPAAATVADPSPSTINLSDPSFPQNSLPQTSESQTSDR